MTDNKLLHAVSKYNPGKIAFGGARLVGGWNDYRILLQRSSRADILHVELTLCESCFTYLGSL